MLHGLLAAPAPTPDDAGLFNSGVIIGLILLVLVIATLITAVGVQGRSGRDDNAQRVKVLFGTFEAWLIAAIAVTGGILGTMAVFADRLFG